MSTTQNLVKNTIMFGYQILFTNNFANNEVSDLGVQCWSKSFNAENSQLVIQKQNIQKIQTPKITTNWPRPFMSQIFFNPKISSPSTPVKTESQTKHSPSSLVDQFYWRSPTITPSSITTIIGWMVGGRSQLPRFLKTKHCCRKALQFSVFAHSRLCLCPRHVFCLPKLTGLVNSHVSQYEFYTTFTTELLGYEWDVKPNNSIT